MPRVCRGSLPLLALTLLAVSAARVAAQASSALHVVLLETHVVGVDEVVGRFVDRALRAAVQNAGYELLPSDAGRNALVQMGAAYPPSVSDLWRLTYRLRADRGVFAVASANAGRYVIQVHVASLDGRGPFDAEGTSGSEDLESRAAALVSQALQEAAATSPPEQPATAAGSPPAVDALAAKPNRSFFPDSGAQPIAQSEHWRLAVHDAVAFGIAKQSFVNDVLGARVDLRVAMHSWLGAYVGYAMLPGREGRVHSVLSYVQLEQRIPIVGDVFQLPLRFDFGYLARNGGYLRLVSGLSLALSRRIEVVLDLLAPTFWMTPDTTLFSLDLGAEVNVTL